MHQHFKKIILIGAAILATGCATSRSEVHLGTSSNTAQINLPASAPLALIRSVKDERVFEQAPGEPSTPSLGFEGADNAAAAIKARAIARKRNGYGRALGDVLLPEGQTVESVIRDNVRQTLNQLGYRVSLGSATEKPAMTIDVHIKKFWSWMNPGFATIGLQTEIETDIDMGGVKKTARGYMEDRRGMVTDAVWAETTDQGLSLYREDLQKKLGK